MEGEIAGAVSIETNIVTTVYFAVRGGGRGVTTKADRDVERVMR
jgi:hypothetical protein